MKKKRSDVPSATAILDRFLHHAEIIRLSGKSYRLRNQGLATEETADDSKPAIAPIGKGRNRTGSKPVIAPIGSEDETADSKPANAPIGSKTSKAET